MGGFTTVSIAGVLWGANAHLAELGPQGVRYQFPRALRPLSWRRARNPGWAKPLQPEHISGYHHIDYRVQLADPQRIEETHVWRERYANLDLHAGEFASADPEPPWKVNPLPNPSLEGGNEKFSRIARQRVAEGPNVQILPTRRRPLPVRHRNLSG